MNFSTNFGPVEATQELDHPPAAGCPTAAPPKCPIRVASGPLADRIHTAQAILTNGEKP